MSTDEHTQQLGPGQVRLRIHSPSPDSQQVSASVLARKLGTLVRALKAAGHAANRKSVFDYNILRMNTLIPTIVLTEALLPKKHEGLFVKSGVESLANCMDAIIVGESERALAFGSCASHVAKLADGAPKRFGYAEVRALEQVFRVDSFMGERANTAIGKAPRFETVASAYGDQPYKGRVFASFEGKLEFVDARGALPEIKLILEGGPAHIDCVCREDHIEKIRGSLRRRVRVQGSAIYDGVSTLPRRVEVTDIKSVPDNVGFSRWKGSFEPFEVEPWGAD